MKPLNLTVLSVVFEDGTGDGDNQATNDINDRRRGEKIALTRIIPLLQTASKAADSEIAASAKKLKQQISEICDELAKQHSGGIQGGIRHGQGYVLADIEEAEGKQEQGQNSLRQELSRIQDKYQRKSARLKDYL